MPFRLLTIVADLAKIGTLQHAVGHIDMLAVIGQSSTNGSNVYYLKMPCL
jgi:hypothetical protein